MTRSFRIALLLIAGMAVGAVSGACTPSPNKVRQVASVAVSSAITVPVGLNGGARATATYSDGGTADVTAAASWSIDDTSVAELGGSSAGPGELTGRAEGSTTLTASFRGVTGSTRVSVVPAVLVGVTISPIISLGAGESASYRADGVRSDNSTFSIESLADWSSSDTNVVGVDNSIGSGGNAFGVTAGRATVRVAFESASASVEVTVAGTLESIAVTPNPLVAFIDLPTEAVATGTFSGPSGTYQRVVTNWAEWETSDPSVASVFSSSYSRYAVGVGPGSTQMTARLAGRSGITEVDVSA